MKTQKAFEFVILGCGQRGQLFADWLHEHPEAGRVVAIAEPKADRRAHVAQQHAVPPDMQFESWEDLLARPRLADAAINTLMDRLHMPSALKALDAGYHMLLEKPMATTLEDCVAIDAARRRNKRIVSICHSLRYHRCYAEVKRLLDDGAIGKLVSFDQIECVDPVHQAHSFVRGNWGVEAKSAFMLLAKSCHDIDLVAYLVGKPCLRVSSFGHRSHFRKEQAPEGAPKRCTDGCPVETECPYSSYKVYVEGSPYANLIGLHRFSRDERLQFVHTAPYGRCVYHCDNDVVDHQVVNFEFGDHITGTFTMTAFAPGNRQLRLHGTHGYITADLGANTISLKRFWGSGTRENIVIPPQVGGHGGGDDNTMKCFIQALRTNDPKAVLTTTEESLRTHTITFAAERARKEGRVVELSEMMKAQGRRI